MDDLNNSKKWLTSFSFAAILMSLCVCLSVFLIDPFFQFRVRDHQYFLNAAYVSAGLIKNYDYDTVIIGSCMVENYDISRFNNELDVNAVKIGCGGLGPDGVQKYTSLSNEVGKAKNYYINVDFTSFREDGSDESILGLQDRLRIDEFDYLIQSDLLSNLKYMFCYESWFRFIPVDIGLIAYKTAGGDLSQGKLGIRTSVARTGEWTGNFKYGEDVVMKSREGLNKPIPINDKSEQEEILRNMISNMDLYVNSIDFTAGQYNFIFPPYSYLFWEDAKQANKFDIYMQAKEHMIDSLKNKGGVVYDFQDMDETYDLNYYKDTSHYSKDLNDRMIDCMASGEYRR